MGSLTVRAAVQAFLAAVKGDVAPSTFNVYRHYLERFVARFSRIRVDAVTPAMLAAWTPKYHGLACVARLYRWLTHEALLLERNPLAGMRKKRQGHRRRILSRGERLRLLKAMPPAARRLAVALVESIARPRELREATWGHIRCDGGTAWTVGHLAAGKCYLWFERFKGQGMRSDRYAVRVVPISPRLGRQLARRIGADRGGAGALWSNERGRPWTHNAVRIAFRKARRRAGLAPDAAGEKVVAYTLRHTGATEATAAGLRAFHLAELMGHSDIRMTQRYVHLRPDALMDAARRLWAKKRRPGLRRTHPD